ncbi:MAG TPA: PQQ-binding-like beta-propeller repeat protein, partial [Pyrinomonadaceae bacterium]
MEKLVRKLTLVVSAWLVTLLGQTGAECQRPDGASMFRANPARTGVQQTRGPQTFCKVKWKFKAGSELESTPVIADGVMYVATYSGSVHALDLNTGKEKRSPFQDKRRDKFSSSPLVADKTVYFLNQDGCLYALDTALSKKGWSDEGVRLSPVNERSLVVSSPVMSDRTLFVGTSDGYLYALNSTTRNTEWKFKIEVGG